MEISRLSGDWKPRGAECFTWVSMDRFGKLAVMYNTGFGELPDCLLVRQNAESMMDDLMEFLYEESKEFKPSFNAGGDFVVDLYSSSFYKECRSKSDVQNYFVNDLKTRKNISDANLCANKGMYYYESLDHENIPGERPVGYIGEVDNGDYYRHLMPTVFSKIDDIPASLRAIVSMSNILDFSKAQLITKSEIKNCFQKLCS